MKDIFVDDCVAVRMENPLDPSLIEFTIWLDDRGVLVLTHKILKEYGDSLSRGGASTFLTIVAKLQRYGRVYFIDSANLKKFRFKKKDESGLSSNRKDWPHIKAVLLSPRKLALSFDRYFLNDVNGFPGFHAKASSRPGDLPFA